METVMSHVDSAKRSARLLRAALRDKGMAQPLHSCQQLVARLAGWADWHQLERAGRRIDATKRQDLVLECMPSTDPDVVLSMVEQAMPGHGRVFASLPSGLNVGMVRKGHTLLVSSEPDWEITPFVIEQDGITIRSVLSLDERFDDPSPMFEGEDHPLDVKDMPDIHMGEVKADVMDMQWEIHDDGGLVAVAAGTLYQAREGTNPRTMARDVDLSGVGNGRIIHMLPMGEDFIGCLLVVTAFEVATEHRGRGVGRRLLSSVLLHAEARSIGVWPVRLIVDMEAISETLDGPVDLRALATAARDWTATITRSKLYVHDPLMYPMDGFPEALSVMPNTAENRMRGTSRQPPWKR
jgi:GNAT superfamily N-acetyltransferase